MGQTPELPRSAAARPVGQPVHALQAALAAQPSATAVLQARCDARHLPGRPTITATLLPPRPAPDSVRAALGVAAGAPLRGRHVALACGDTVLSEAYNWYVPERLTPAMNHALETTDIPFGRAVHDLAFTRATLSSRVLGAESAPSVLENHGLLRRGVDSAPIAYVIETYRDAAL